MNKSGFTLVELSIVLVVIGLLIGGILVGRSLIDSAKINKQIQQIEQIQIAVNQFKNKFKSLPGDTTKLGSGGAQPTATTAGNNDGRILGYIFHNNVQADVYNLSGNNQWIFNTGWRSEWTSVFDHLALVKMYKFEQYTETSTALTNRYPGIMYPKMIVPSNASGTDIVPIGGVVVGYEPGPVANINAGHKIKLGQCPSSITWSQHSDFWCGPNPVDAAAIDNKLDDGNPYTGSVYITAIYTYRVPNGLVGNDTNACGNSTTNKYRVTSTTANCIPTIDANF